MPKSANKDFVVIHTNGIHVVDLDYCGCSEIRNSPETQLLRTGWWPATMAKPKTCATMQALRHFHLQNLQGHVTAFDFYRALELETDNCGLHPFPVSKPLLLIATGADCLLRKD